MPQFKDVKDGALFVEWDPGASELLLWRRLANSDRHAIQYKEASFRDDGGFITHLSGIIKEFDPASSVQLIQLADVNR
jgi:hypothetical protein